MVYREIAAGEVVELQGRRVTAIPANHTVPAVGYLLESARGALIFSGDTAGNDALWKAVNRTPNLKYLIIETAFSNKERDIALASKHLCPKMLAEELEKMRVMPEVYITHLKPEGVDDEGSERGGGPLEAADAREQPGILVLGGHSGRTGNGSIQRRQVQP